MFLVMHLAHRLQKNIFSVVRTVSQTVGIDVQLPRFPRSPENSLTVSSLKLQPESCQDDAETQVGLPSLKQIKYLEKNGAMTREIEDSQTEEENTYAIEW